MWTDNYGTRGVGPTFVVHEGKLYYYFDTNPWDNKYPPVSAYQVINDPNLLNFVSSLDSNTFKEFETYQFVRKTCDCKGASKSRYIIYFNDSAIKNVAFNEYFYCKASWPCNVRDSLIYYFRPYVRRSDSTLNDIDFFDRR